MVNVASPVQHDFDAQPLCEVPVQLSLRNCLQSPASLLIETGSSHERPEHQQSGKLCLHACMEHFLCDMRSRLDRIMLVQLDLMPL